MHQSIATIDSPEFINLQPLDISPLMSSCEIKVLYIGENRNKSFITKEVAMEMSKTLRGAPIVGYYNSNKDDFSDHGEKVTIDDEGIHFECLTKPYGFVAPDAKVWFQKFEETDEFGESVVREYLMTTGYLWTEQFKECAAVLEEGRPQSMELDEKTLKGSWAQNNKTGIEFFIINDAIFSKLCILGEEVEPCFEGASVTAPVVSSSYTLDDGFKNTLFTMMQELKKVVSEGGKQMDNLETKAEDQGLINSAETQFENQENNAEEAASEYKEKKQCKSELSEEKKDKENQCKSELSEEKKDKGNQCKSELSEEEKFAQCDPKKEKDRECDPDDDMDDDMDDKDDKDKDDDYACKKKKYELLEAEYEELQNKYSALEVKYNELVEFKAGIDNAKKDELINSFDMISEEDKQDIIANKSSYSLEEIEEKLSVLFTRQYKKKEQKEQEHSDVVMTFSFAESGDTLPDWLKAVREVEDSMNK